MVPARAHFNGERLRETLTQFTVKNIENVNKVNRERWRLLIDRFWARRPGSSLYGGIFRSIFLFSKFCLKKLLQLRASLMVKSGSGVIFFDQFFLCYKFCLKKILWVPGQPRVCHSALYWFVLAFSFTALYQFILPSSWHFVSLILAAEYFRWIEVWCKEKCTNFSGAQFDHSQYCTHWKSTKFSNHIICRLSKRSS